MEEKELAELAAQLRKPHGVMGIRTGELMNEGNRMMNLEAIRLLQVQGNVEILEIGMGNGRFVNEVLRAYPGSRYTGVDFSSTMVNEAESFNAEAVQQGRAGFLEGDLRALPVQDEMYDAAFTVNTIYFWDEAQSALKEIGRVLKAGGVVLISLRPRRHMQNYPFTRYGFKLYEPEEVLDLLGKNGFVKVSVNHVQEPDLEFNGQQLKMEHAVVRGVRK